MENRPPIRRGHAIRRGCGISRVAMLVAALMLAVASPNVLVGAEKAAKKKEAKPPVLLLAVPVGLVAGQTNELTLRGQNLDSVESVTTTSPGVELGLRKKGKTSAPSGQPAERVGDTQVEIAVTVPEDFTGPTVSVRATNPDGTSQERLLPVLRQGEITDEREPNGGFATAQSSRPPALVRGEIKERYDVDVFTFEGRAGDLLTAETLAARHGSGFDAILILWDATKNRVAGDDDSGEGRDAKLIYRLPVTGRYYLSLQDAHDQGGPAHPYLLRIRVEGSR